MPFKGLFVGSYQSIQKRCYNSTTVEQLGFLHISVIYRYIEYIGQSPDNFDETGLATANHYNSAFMNTYGQLQ